MTRCMSFVVFICVICITIGDSRSELSTHDRIRKDGYPSETFDLITADGYILQMNRIPRGKNDFDFFRRRPVVFLQHGLQSSASSFLGIDVNSSLAYKLADIGFDVWMGNARGVKNSRRHLFLSPDNEETKRQFWDFTFEEIALIDMPRMINFALSHTRQEKLHYIGHSQGGTVFLILNSRKPEYNKKFISAHLLAGVGYQDNFPNKILSIAAARTDDILAFTSTLGFVEVNGPTQNGISQLGELLETKRNNEIINNILDLISLIKNAMEELTRAKESLGGAAVKQYGHYGQNVRDKSFRSFDHGLIGNLLKYGRLTPPQYDLKNIKVDTTMHYTLGDVLLDELDVLAMAGAMPHCKVRKVARKTFSHTDFLLAKDTSELVFEYLINDLIRRT